MVTIIPVIIIGFSAYSISADIFLNRESDDIKFKLETIQEDALYLIEQKQMFGIDLHINDSIQKLLSDDLGSDDFERINLEFDMRLLMSDSEKSKGVHSITIISNKDISYSMANNKFTVSEDKGVFERDAHNFESKYSYYWTSEIANNDSTLLLRYSRPITSIESSSLIGIIYIDLYEDEMNNFYKEIEIQSGTRYYIINRKNTIISASNEGYIGSQAKEEFGIDTSDLTSDIGHFNTKIDGEDVLLVYNMDNPYGFLFIGILPMSEVLNKMNYIRTNTYLISFVSILICFTMGIVFANSISRPLRKLNEQINNVENGNVRSEFVPKYNDEIGKLAKSYNNMILGLDDLIKQIYIEQNRKKEAEINALIFQINPHFLYNTMSLLIWQIRAKDNDNAMKTAQALSDFFRITLSRGKETITIKEELQHIRSYLNIQERRFVGKFDVYYDISDSILDLYIPKIILQPIVENSIKHGLIENKNKKGTIKICGKQIDGVIEIRIIDNGDISIEKIKHMNTFLTTKEFDKEYGIGIRNVNDRITLKFGDEYGLKYKKEGIFTIAVITLPIIREDK